jgi:hypothetical protein
MSKGIGKTQQFVLDILKRKDKEISLIDIAGSIGLADGDDWVRPSRPQVESVKRAVKTLQQRGLICYGYSQIDKLGGNQHLVCWLADSKAPCTSDRIKGKLVEDAIMTVLKNNNRPRSYYGDVSREVREVISTMHPGYLRSWGQYPAFSRAVKRLINRGKLKIEHEYSYKWERFLSVV